MSHASDDGEQQGGGLTAQHIRMDEGHQIHAGAPGGHSDIRLHMSVFPINQPAALARRHGNWLDKARHDAAVEQLNIERIFVRFLGQFTARRRRRAFRQVATPAPDLLPGIDRKPGVAHQREQRAEFIHFGREHMRAPPPGFVGDGVQQAQPCAVFGIRFDRSQQHDLRQMIMRAHAKLADDWLCPTLRHQRVQTALRQQNALQQSSARGVGFACIQQIGVQQCSPLDQAAQQGQIHQFGGVDVFGHHHERLPSSTGHTRESGCCNAGIGTIRKVITVIVDPTDFCWQSRLILYLHRKPRLPGGGTTAHDKTQGHEAEISTASCPFPSGWDCPAIHATAAVTSQGRRSRCSGRARRGPCGAGPLQFRTGVWAA